MRDIRNPLGSFLRTRRELVTPLEAGISDGGVRRVPGLRREEVAMLAGISADYYLRLERGRDRHPSVQVLESIARVLQLDDAHLAHLLALVAETPRRRPRRARNEIPPARTLALLSSLSQPAFIEGRYFDVLASNRLARALSPDLEVGGNQLRDLFLNPAVQALHPDWEAVAECFVASLRQSVGNDLRDPGFIDLTEELALASTHFRQLWARHEVRAQRGTDYRLDHPEVGELVVNRERLSIGGTDGMMLVIYHAAPGSDAAEKLALLASTDLPHRRRGEGVLAASSR